MPIYLSISLTWTLNFLPAVKITGATALDSTLSDDSYSVMGENGTGQSDCMNVCNPATEQGCKEGTAPDAWSVEECAVHGVVSGDESESASSVQSEVEDDGDLLNLLVDTLDCEFDPNLLV